MENICDYCEQEIREGDHLELTRIPKCGRLAICEDCRKFAAEETAKELGEKN